MRLILIAALLAPLASGATRFQPALDAAFSRLYSSDFEGAQTLLDQYISTHPGDPVPYSVKASGYLFHELDRLGILESDFFQDDRAIAGKKRSVRPDAHIHDLFYQAIGKSQSIAQETLVHSPDDANALFALCLGNGDLTDYVALIEKRQLQSLSINKAGYRHAKHLLRIAPDFYDAYLTTGFTEYIIGSMPIVFRWFVRFDDVKGDKQQGVRNLQNVALNGHYLKPFAKILLATAYLREKRFGDARDLLRELTQAFPQNGLLKHELDRLSTRM